MENLVFERDYTKNRVQSTHSEQLPDIIEQLISGGFIEKYMDTINAVPKIIVPEYKANYEYVLQACDDLAKYWDGSVRGVVDYKHWEANITLILPYAEFTSPEDLEMLRDIAEKSHGVTIRPVNDSLHIHIHNRYFEDLISEKGKNFIAYDCIMRDKKLVEMLGLSTDLTPRMQAFVEYMNSVLDTLEEVTGQDRTSIVQAFLARVATTIGEEDCEEDAIIMVMEQVAHDMIEENTAQ